MPRPSLQDQQLLAGSASTSSAGRAFDEIQSLAIDAQVGTFTLGFSGQTTAPIAAPPTAGTIQAALNALSTIGAGGVRVSGSSSPFQIRFASYLLMERPQPLITVDVSAATGPTTGPAVYDGVTSGTYGAVNPGNWGSFSPVEGATQYDNTQGDSATWTITGLTPGLYRVSSTWAVRGNGTAGARFRALDGATVLATSNPVNLTIAPAGFVDSGPGGQNQWRDIGPGIVSLAGTALTIVEDYGAYDGNYLYTTGVRIEPHSSATGSVARVQAASSSSHSSGIQFNGGGQGFTTVPTAGVQEASTLSFAISMEIDPASGTFQVADYIFGQAGNAESFTIEPVGGKTNQFDIVIRDNANKGVSNRITLSPGSVHLIAGTWTAGGPLTTYVDLNAPVVTSAAGVGNLYTSPGGLLPIRFGFVPAGYTGIKVTLDQPALWVGYALTPSDVAALVNGTRSPLQISPANLVFALSCDGPNGQAAAVGDDGLTDRSPAANDIVSVAGTPTYLSPSLQWSPSARIRSATVAPSGKGILIILEDRNGQLSNVVSIGTNPTISVNGGAPISLTNPLWGVAQTPAPYSPTIYYPLTTPILATDRVTITAPEAWATTAEGVVAAISGQAANAVGGSLLPPFVEGPKTMAVGYNIGLAPVPYSTTLMYANLAPQLYGWNKFGGTFLNLDSNNYPTSFDGSFAYVNLTGSTGNGYDSLGYATAPASGQWTLMWDGPAYAPDGTTHLLSLAVSSSGGTCVEDLSRRNLAGTTDNTLVFEITQDQTQLLAPSVYLYLYGPWPSSTGAIFSNLRVYPPDVATDGFQKFHPNYLAQIAGAKCLRLMKTIAGNGGSNIVDFSDFQRPGMLGYANPSRTYGGQVASVGPFTDSAGYFASRFVPILITYSRPHGTRPGVQVSISAQSMAGPHGNGYFDCVDGSQVLLAGEVGLAMYIPSSTEVVIGIQGSGPNGGGTLAQTYTPGPGETWSTSDPCNPGIPLQDAADLANAVGADLWVCAPYSATDACVTEMIQVLGSRLKPRSKLYLEYANETWNFDYGGFGWTYTQSNAAGMDYHQWYAMRASQVHDLAEAALAGLGRGGDLVRVFGSFAVDPSITQDICNYCLTNGKRIDAIAVAPYFHNDMSGLGTATEPSLDAIYDSLDVDQILDYAELTIQYGGYENYVAPHVQYLPAGCTLVGYEGGPEYGLPGASVTSGADYVHRTHLWTRHPRFRGVMLYFLQMLQDSGMTLFNDFLASSQNEDSGGTSWQAYYAWNQKPGLGDGSDGLFDNRANFEDYGNLVSVVGGAIGHWNTLRPAPPSPGALPPRYVFPKVSARKVKIW